MYVGKASNANPTSSYPPFHASMAWGPTICICEMNVWCLEALWLAATWMDTCAHESSLVTEKGNLLFVLTTAIFVVLSYAALSCIFLRNQDMQDAQGTWDFTRQLLNSITSAPYVTENIIAVKMPSRMWLRAVYRSWSTEWPLSSCCSVWLLWKTGWCLGRLYIPYFIL